MEPATDAPAASSVSAADRLKHVRAKVEGRRQSESQRLATIQSKRRRIQPTLSEQAAQVQENILARDGEYLVVCLLFQDPLLLLLLLLLLRLLLLLLMMMFRCCCCYCCCSLC